MRIRSARAAGCGAQKWGNPPIQPRFDGQDLRVFRKSAKGAVARCQETEGTRIPAAARTRPVLRMFLKSAKGAVPRRQETEGTRISTPARTRPVLRVFFKRVSVLAAGFFLSLFAAGGASSKFAVGPQYDTTHVYVAPQDFDRFVASLVATFGGTATKQGVFTVTPTPSSTMSQLVLTPAGTVSVFGFKTPIPYPFGLERTGYLVTDLDGSVKAAQADGAEVVVAPFNDPIGRDVVIRWPGGVNMQLYWHTTPPSYAPLKTIPENRVYLSALAG